MPASRAVLALACVATAATGRQLHGAQQGDEQGLLQTGFSVHVDEPIPGELWYPFEEMEELEMDGSKGLSCMHVTPMMGTMKSGNKLHAVVDIMKRLHAEAVKGDVVEAGVAQGGGVLPILYYMGCTGDLVGRTFHLFDTWQGLPASSAKEDEGFGKGMYHETFDTFLDNVRRYEEAYNSNVVGRSFETGTPVATWEEVWSHVKIVKGLFADTMPLALAKAPVALLCCDGDMYQSTKDCFDAAGSRLVKGATVYNDDYFTFEGCYKATQEYIHERRAKGQHASPVHLVPQSGGFEYFDETADCVPPQDNKAGGGVCKGKVSEAAVFTVS